MIRHRQNSFSFVAQITNENFDLEKFDRKHLRTSYKCGQALGVLYNTQATHDKSLGPPVCVNIDVCLPIST